MTTTKNIHQRILAVMSEVESIRKTPKKKGMHYDYISHDAVTSVLHPQFVKHGITVFPEVIDKKHDGNRCELVVRFKFFNADDPSETAEVVAVGYGLDSQDKGPGKAMSYAMKTALLKVFVLESAEPDNEADQTTEHTPDNKKITKAPPAKENGFIQPSNVEMLTRVAAKGGLTATELDSYLDMNFKIPKADQIPLSQFSEILTDLKRLQPVDK